MRMTKEKAISVLANHQDYIHHDEELGICTMAPLMDALVIAIKTLRDEVDGQTRIPLRPGDVLYEADPEHGVVKHTVTDVYWGANTNAVDDNGQTWADYYTNEDIETAHTTREAAEAQKEVER